MSKFKQSLHIIKCLFILLALNETCVLTLPGESKTVRGQKWESGKEGDNWNKFASEITSYIYFFGGI